MAKLIRKRVPINRRILLRRKKIVSPRIMQAMQNICSNYNSIQYGEGETTSMHAPKEFRKPNPGYYAIALDNIWLSKTGINITPGSTAMVIKVNNDVGPFSPYDCRGIEVLYKEKMDLIYADSTRQCIYVPVTNKLKDKSFVITGTLTWGRKIYESLIKLSGGQFKSAITGGVDYLVVGNIGQSSKLKKAKQLGIQIIDENKFFELLK